MITILLGAGLNIILDPILILDGYGSAGAALATVISQGCRCLGDGVSC